MMPKQQADRGIPSNGYAGVFLPDQGNAAVAEPSRNGAGVIGGTVIDDHRGPVGVRLVENGRHAVTQVRSEIERGNDDSDVHELTQARGSNPSLSK